MSWFKRWGLGGLVGLAGFAVLSLASNPDPAHIFGVNADHGGWSALVPRVAFGLLLAHVACWWSMPEQGGWAAGSFGALAGLSLFLLIFDGSRVDPQQLEWLDAAGPELQTAQQGWTEFRALDGEGSEDSQGMAGWRRDIGGTLLINGSIPLLALPARAWSEWLPDPMQYLGLWSLLGFCLQGALGGLLMRCLTHDPRLQMVGTGFFLLNPLWLGCLDHPAASAHWLLLGGLWLYFRASGNGHPGRLWIGWLMLLTLGLAVHGQLAFTVLLLAITFLARTLWVDRSIGWGKALLWMLLLAGLVAGAGYALGYRDSFTLTGSPLPACAEAASPKLEFGLGVWLLGAWCLLMVLMRPLDPTGIRPWIPLVILGGVMLLLTVLPGIWSTGLVFLDVSCHLPPAVGEWFAASHRHAWLVAYALTFLVVALLVHAHPPRRAILLLSLALALQAYSLVTP